MMTSKKHSEIKPGININRIRAEFPMLSKRTGGKRIIYFDSAASSHKPNVVIKALQKGYLEAYAKPNEEHGFSKAMTLSVESVRAKVSRMLGAEHPKTIIFTKGCTEGINIVARGFADAILERGDEIIITQLEHHANIIPWQMASEQTGAIIKVVPVKDNGDLDMEALEHLITDRTKIVSVSHTSHVLGTILPVEKIAELAHRKGAAVLLDGAQAAPHMPVDMRSLDCDFYTFSVHKMGGPTGLGVLYGKEKWLNEISPLLGGGEMAREVTFESTLFEDLPKKFEAGTIAFVEIMAFGTLIDYLQKLNMRKTAQYEVKLMNYATDKLSQINGVKIYGTSDHKEPVISFDVRGRDVKKLEKYLNDEWSISVRAGELTAQPLMKVLGVKQLIRVSFCYYNTFKEIDTFIEAIQAFMRKKVLGESIEKRIASV